MSEYIALVNTTNLEKPFSIHMAGVSSANPNERIYSKKNTTSTLEYVISGKGLLCNNGKQIHFQAGDLYFLPKGREYVTYADKEKPWKKIYISTYGSLLPRIMHSYFPDEIVKFSNRNCYSFLKQILKICMDDEHTIEEKGDSVLIVIQKLIIYLHRSNNKQNELSDANIIKTYMDNYYYRNIKGADLSKLIFKSESQAIRIFKDAYGIPPYQYLMKIRLEAAEQLLENTSMTVKEIAFSLSFSNEHYFSYLFKKKTGHTPTNFRKAHQMK